MIEEARLKGYKRINKYGENEESAIDSQPGWE